MQVIITNMRVAPTTHGGHDIVYLHGYYLDEFGEKCRGDTSIDPKHANWQDWEPVIEHMARHPGHDFILDGIRMKSKATGKWNGDSRPTVVDTIPRPMKRVTSTNNNYSRHFDEV